MTGPFDLTGRVAVVPAPIAASACAWPSGSRRLGQRTPSSGEVPRKNQAAVAKITEAVCEAMAIEPDVVQEDDCRRLVREAGARSSSASDFITGTAIPVDGAHSLEV